jgi:hypothetical protein
MSSTGAPFHHHADSAASVEGGPQPDHSLSGSPTVRQAPTAPVEHTAPTNAFSSVRTQLNAYPTPHLDQHSTRRYLRLP